MSQLPHNRPPLALNQLKTKDLENLLRAVHRGDLECPLSHERLTRAGLSYLWDRTEFLNGFEKATVVAILVAVIAERPREVATIRHEQG